MFRNDNFPLFYVKKMSLRIRRGVGGSKSPQTPLRNIGNKMYKTIRQNKFTFFWIHAVMVNVSSVGYRVSNSRVQNYLLPT